MMTNDGGETPDPPEAHARRFPVSKKYVYIATSCALAVIVILVGCLFVSQVGRSSPSRSAAVTVTPRHTATSASASPTPAQAATFTSSSLGIAFDYAPTLGGDALATQAQGDTVYVYDKRLPYTQGEYVKVFTKDPQQSLQQAVTQIILQGYDPANCLLGDAHGAGTYYPASYRTVSIYYNETSSDPQAGWPPQDPSLCPAQYTVTTGVSYFLMDTSHPDKLLFFSIGQIPIAASANPANQMAWQDTVRFL